MSTVFAIILIVLITYFLEWCFDLNFQYVLLISFVICSFIMNANAYDEIIAIRVKQKQIEDLIKEIKSNDIYFFEKETTKKLESIDSSIDHLRDLIWNKFYKDYNSD